MYINPPITSICLKVPCSSKERNPPLEIRRDVATGDGAAALVNPVGDGRAPFSALPSPFGPWEEKERRKKEREKEERERKRKRKRKRGRTRKGK